MRTNAAQLLLLWSCWLSMSKRRKQRKGQPSISTLLPEPFRNDLLQQTPQAQWRQYLAVVTFTSSSLSPHINFKFLCLLLFALVWDQCLYLSNCWATFSSQTYIMWPFHIKMSKNTISLLYLFFVLCTWIIPNVSDNVVTQKSIFYLHMEQSR